jgi:hypothetical protein
MLILYLKFSILDSGSRIQVINISDPGPHHRVKVFFTQKIVSKLSKILSEMFILDPALINDPRCSFRIRIYFHPDPDFFPFRIRILDLGVKKHLILDPDPPHCRFLTFFPPTDDTTFRIIAAKVNLVLLVFSQLVIKAVVDSSLRLGRQVDIENLPLRQFFVILDLVFRHGFKSGKVASPSLSC